MCSGYSWLSLLCVCLCLCVSLSVSFYKFSVSSVSCIDRLLSLGSELPGLRPVSPPAEYLTPFGSARLPPEICQPKEVLHLSRSRRRNTSSIPAHTVKTGHCAEVEKGWAAPWEGRTLHLSGRNTGTGASSLW